MLNYRWFKRWSFSMEYCVSNDRGLNRRKLKIATNVNRRKEKLIVRTGSAVPQLGSKSIDHSRIRFEDLRFSNISDNTWCYILQDNLHLFAEQLHNGEIYFLLSVNLFFWLRIFVAHATTIESRSRGINVVIVTWKEVTFYVSQNLSKIFSIFSEENDEQAVKT